MAAPLLNVLKKQLPLVNRPSSAVYLSSVRTHTSTLPSTSLRSFLSAAPMAASKTFMDAVKTRRTYYQINKEAPISDDRIVEIVKDAVYHTPSSFNSQSSRLVVLLKKEHDEFWDQVKTVLKAILPEDKYPATEQRLNGFQAGYGTILFFEAPEPVQALQKQFPQFADHFPQWSEHTSAMHQYVLWTALEAEGFGANLQHYNPIIDQKAQTHWKIPMTWSLKAQLVFGGRAGKPGEKQFQAIEERVFVHGK
ncbi:putative nitroreductase [Cryomyces antarcticus]|uniref:Nitroreductase n=1 Tax=Cryomyces antarcticus TaxID=329879 RepID=A0ABR0LW35_9PEZI|nr:putative nitroreductase [Cryomyces antarcticus]